VENRGKKGVENKPLEARSFEEKKKGKPARRPPSKQQGRQKLQRRVTILHAREEKRERREFPPSPRRRRRQQAPKQKCNAFDAPYRTPRSAKGNPHGRDENTIQAKPK